MPSANNFVGGLPQSDGIALDRIDNLDVEIMVDAPGGESETTVLDAKDRPDVFTIRSLHLHVRLDLRRVDHGLPPAFD